MPQEPQKNSTVLILVAIIGVIGTIVATSIGVIGNYNIEKFRQEAELTRIALVSIVAQGESTQAAMASTIAAPTNTFIPTTTPIPVNTNTPSPTSTSTLIPTPTPDPRIFWDDFEVRIKPEWNMTGDNFISANGKLTVVGYCQGTIGDSSWTNYRVTIGKSNYDVEPKVTVLFRVQDRDNYMKLFCERRGSGYGEYYCDIFKVINGEGLLIPGTPFIAGWGEHIIQIEAENDIFRIIVDNQDKFRFTDSTYSNGGVSLQINAANTFEVDSFEVRTIP
jgi:hypothetical protein